MFSKIITLVSLTLQARVDTRIRAGNILGRAWAPLPRFAAYIGWFFARGNYNNIMLHARGLAASDKIELADTGTFNFSRYAERRALQETARLIKVPFVRWTAYLTSGGTEANIYALWVAREWAWKKLPNTVHWIVPVSAHYSIEKALHILGIDRTDRNLIHRVQVGTDGVTSWEEIRRILNSVRAQSTDPIVCVMTAMTTEFGMLDPAAELNQYLEKTNDQNVFFHLDAAFSAFVLPGIEKYQDYFLNLNHLSSISVDYHKILGAPTGTGAVFITDGLEEYVKVPAAYLRDSADYTLVGSRRGIDAVVLFALLRAESPLSMKSRVTAARTKALWLYYEFSKFKQIRPLYIPFANYLVVEIDESDSVKRKQIELVLSKYAVTSSKVVINDVSREFYKLILRADTPNKTLRNCVRELQNVV